MTTAQLKNEIKNLSIEMNITFIEACQLMQSASAKLGNEKMIIEIHKIKMASL
ncbi:hypothetical protein Phi19:1_gp046 [Cellulophaga phage phi19:1]|uniref:Uncharacterized protein n=1 Tax=Cellulophaga phage phi19:1 TaxID=1327970 RepID=R9ZW65_9CAUD|nr:hypothetical protein Phi19:1_gp046 [Cellulophaga phage phi19:1]AGO47336.1 hypothetical protein Phi19:1_gp046 [Cellulophaga phage phi19:1]